MTSQHFFAFLKAYLGSMALVGLLFAAASFFGLMFLEKPYQSSMDFLVVQTNGQGQDFYTQFKSSEYLGKVLSEAIYSERFINAIVESGKMNSEFLPSDKKDRLRTWGDMVSVKKNLELGIISVTVKNDRERDVARVIDGIAEVLTQKNSLFRGGDEKSVEIRVLSGPIVERNPTLVKILEVVAGGFFAGFFLTGFWLMIRSDALSRQREKADDISLDDVLR
jgi:capsular polysaccharide biosynthesis protein